MKNEIEAMITDITTTTAEAEEMCIRDSGVTGINGGKGKYPLNISQKKSFIHFVRQTHIS